MFEMIYRWHEPSCVILLVREPFKNSRTTHHKNVRRWNLKPWKILNQFQFQSTIDGLSFSPVFTKHFRLFIMFSNKKLEGWQTFHNCTQARTISEREWRHKTKRNRRKKKTICDTFYDQEAGDSLPQDDFAQGTDECFSRTALLACTREVTSQHILFLFHALISFIVLIVHWFILWDIFIQRFPCATRIEATIEVRREMNHLLKRFFLLSHRIWLINRLIGGTCLMPFTPNPIGNRTPEELIGNSRKTYQKPNHTYTAV